MSKLYKKSILLVATIVLMSTFLVQVSRASIFDSFFKIFGAASENEINNEESIESASQEVEEYLSDRQKEVVAKIEDIYVDILKLNLDKLASSIDYKIPKDAMDNIKYFFDTYSEGYSNLKSILKTIQYRIDSVRDEDENVIVTITYTCPSMPKLIKKVLPVVIIKNPSILLGAEINNDTIDSALSSIKKELDKGSYEVETFTREFIFEEFGDDWKLVKVDDIVKDVKKYIDDIGKSFFN